MYILFKIIKYIRIFFGFVERRVSTDAAATIPTTSSINENIHFTPFQSNLIPFQALP